MPKTPIKGNTGPPGMSLHKMIFMGLVGIALIVTVHTVRMNGKNGGLGAELKSEGKTEAKSGANLKGSSTSGAPKAAAPGPAPAPKPLQVYQTIPPLPGGQERNIMLVHVGKAGGMTFRKNTAIGCFDEFPHEADMAKREECFNQFQDHNKLSKLTREVAHVENLDDAKVLAATSYVLVIRDPVERIVSAYRNAHPGNCVDNANSVKNHGCSLVEKNMLEDGTHGHLLFKKCFPSPGMEEFAQAVMPPYKNTAPEHWNEFTDDEIVACRKAARDMVAGTPNSGVDPHMQFNYGHFSDNVYRKYPDKEIFALRTEQIMQDMKRLDRLIGGQGDFKEESAFYRHGSENYKPSPLSDSSLHKLCCVLEKELNVYYEIFNLAKNLDADDRGEANFRGRSTCGLWDGEAWISWRKRCWAGMEEPMI